MKHSASGLVAVWAPGLARLLHYERSWWRGDLVAGLTVGALLITQCMAYAPIAGLPPSAALRGAMIGIPMYALLGSSRHLAIGPDPGTATLAAAGLAAVATVGSAAYLQAAAVLAVLVGLFLLAASALRLGFLADLLSRPALVGYLAGLGVSLLVSQLGKLLGVTVTSDDVVGRLRDVVSGIDHLGAATAAMGLSSLVMILVLKRRLPRAPAALVAVVVALVLTWALRLERHGIAVVGSIDASLPSFRLPGLPADDWLRLTATAAGIALVGYADSILTARGVADRHHDRLDANRELSGLGMANLVAGCCRGMPLSSTGSGTAAMSAAGGNTSLGGIVAASFVALGLIAFPGLLADIPLPALAAVVAAAAIGLVDVEALRDLWRVSRVELAVAVVTAASVVVFDVLVGVLLSVALSVTIALSRMTRPHDAVLGHAAHLDGWVDVAAYPDAVTEPGLVVYRFDAPLLFTNADRYCERVLDALASAPGDERWLVLDFEGIGSIDATAVAALRRLVDDVQRSGVEVIALARANHLTLDRLGPSGTAAARGGAAGGPHHQRCGPRLPRVRRPLTSTGDR